MSYNVVLMLNNGLKMKKLVLLCTLAIVSGPALADNSWNSNWTYHGKTWDATSSGGIAQTLVRNGNTLRTTLKVQDCIRNPSNSLGDDCDRNVRRAQVRSHQTFTQNKNLRYHFSVNKPQKNGHANQGGYINFFEIKPWTDGHTGTVPTIALYVNPKTNKMNIVQSLGNHGANPAAQNDVYKDIGVLKNGWNDFKVETNQTTGKHGYVKIFQNGKLIYSYTGKTTYKHNRPIKFWLGPYICCKLPQVANDPDHVFIYRGVNAAEVINVSASVTPAVKPKIRITPSVLQTVRGDRFTDFSNAIQYDTDNSPFALADYIVADFGPGKSPHRLAFGVSGEAVNKLDKPIMFGYKFGKDLIGLATDSSYYGFKGNAGFDLGKTQTTYLVFSKTKEVASTLMLNAVLTYATATAKGSKDILKSNRSHAYGFGANATYLLETVNNESIQVSFNQPLRIEKGEMEFDTFIADFEPEGRELQYAMSYKTDLDTAWKFKTEASYTSDKNNFKGNNDARMMIYFTWRG